MAPHITFKISIWPWMDIKFDTQKRVGTRERWERTVLGYGSLIGSWSKIFCWGYSTLQKICLE